jgi:multimeric flavodoxin WrbA
MEDCFMKILAVVASGREEGNINKICDSIFAGAKNEVKKINLFDYNIKPCKGCYSCTITKKCAIFDDFNRLFELEKEADCLVYGFPIYSHGIPGILKIFIDRHAHAIIPYFDNKQILNYWQKVNAAMTYLKDFKKNRPFLDKKIISVITCSSPGKNGKDIKNARYVLNNFYKEMGLIEKEAIICSDTLFKFDEDKIDKIMESAFNLGASMAE